MLAKKTTGHWTSSCVPWKRRMLLMAYPSECYGDIAEKYQISNITHCKIVRKGAGRAV